MVEILGNKSLIIFLFYLIDNNITSYTLMDMIKNTNISYSSIKKINNKLLKIKVIEISNKFGNTKLYNFNINDKIIKKI